MNMSNEEDTSLRLKKKALLNSGWTLLKPELDIEYFINKVKPDTFFKSLGHYLSSVTAQSSNPFALFSEESEKNFEKFLSKISPSLIPEYSLYSYISGQWPFSKSYYVLDRAKEELTYRFIKKIVTTKLGAPTDIYFLCEDSVFKWEHSSKNLFENLEVPGGKLVAFWPNATLIICSSFQFQENNSNQQVMVWKLQLPNIREYSSKCLNGWGLEIIGGNYELGLLAPEYSLDSFPSYIQKFTEELKQNVFNENSIPNRYNILIKGYVGHGKTRWTHSFAKEVLSKLGYFVMSVDYNCLQNLTIPPFIDKLCIIINDVDNLCLDRAVNTSGQSEKVLSWLDGARCNFIKPFYMEKLSSVVTIMTANSTDRWDEAGLRKGRIHAIYNFDQVNLSEETS